MLSLHQVKQYEYLADNGIETPRGFFSGPNLIQNRILYYSKFGEMSIVVQQDKTSELIENGIKHPSFTSLTAAMLAGENIARQKTAILHDVDPIDILHDSKWLDLGKHNVNQKPK